MKPRIEIRLTDDRLAFEAWDRERHEAIAIPLKEDQPMLVTMLVQNLIGCPRLPDRWTLVLVAGDLVIKNGEHYHYTAALEDGGADVRLNLAQLIAACAPDLDLLERGSKRAVAS